MRRAELFRGLPTFKPEEGERVIRTWRPRLASFYPILIAGILAALVGLLSLLFNPAGWSAALFAVGIAFGGVMWVLAAALCRAHTYILTNRRVRDEFRFWVARARDAPFYMLTNLSTFQDLFGRIFNFGDVRFDTAGTPFPGVRFRGVRDPYAVEREVRKAVDVYGRYKTAR
jgi:uncharacterized membrane protein YdbT with pleckstrin-like domain